MRNYRGEENCENVDWRNELRWRSSSTRSRICLYFTLNFLKLWRSFYRLLDRSVNPLETYELIAYRRPANLPDNGRNFCDKMDHKPIHMSFVRERIHKQLTWKRPCDPWPQSSQMLLLWHQSSTRRKTKNMFLKISFLAFGWDVWISNTSSCNLSSTHKPTFFILFSPFQPNPLVTLNNMATHELMATHIPYRCDKISFVDRMKSAQTYLLLAWCYFFFTKILLLQT